MAEKACLSSNNNMVGLFSHNDIKFKGIACSLHWATLSLLLVLYILPSVIYRLKQESKAANRGILTLAPLRKVSRLWLPSRWEWKRERPRYASFKSIKLLLAWVSTIWLKDISRSEALKSVWWMNPCCFALSASLSNPFLFFFLLLLPLSQSKKKKTYFHI